MQKILASVKSWAVFQKIAATLGPKGKGDLFELLTKHYLLLNPTYNTNLSDVWLLDEVPEKLRATLQLPQRDQGIDLIARTKAGGFWAIQCKYRTGKEIALTWREISTFIGLAFGVCNGIEFGSLPMLVSATQKCSIKRSGSAFSLMMYGALSKRVSLTNLVTDSRASRKRSSR